MTSNEFDAICNISEGLYSSINTIASPKFLRAASDNSRPFPLKFCDLNVIVFHPLVSKIWAGTYQNGIFFDNNWWPS